jgi:hypothetical protein
MLKKTIYQLRSYAQQHTFVFPLVLLLETLLTYGMMGFACGFYWDDWPPLLLSHIAKANIFWTSYLDRPFSSWTFTVMFPLLHNSAWAWQLATMVFRWVGVYFLYLVLSNLFQKQRVVFQWASLLAVVIPVFQYQYISVAFSQHFLTYALFAGSLLCVMLGFKYKKYFWLFYPLSLVLAATHIFMMEYFVGLEILRPFVIYLSLKRFHSSSEHPKRRALLYYLPFFIVLLGYIVWRFVVYPHFVKADASFSNNPFLLYSLISNPVGTLKSFLTTFLSDLRFTFLSSWLDRLWPADLYLESKVLWLSLFLGVLGSLAFYIFFGEKKDETVWISGSEFRNDLLIGLVIYVFGIAPVWITLRQVSQGKFSERFALAAIPGIALILIAVIWKTAKSARNRYLLIILLAALSISYQIQMGSQMAKDYNSQQSFYAELKWRIPELKPDTGLYSPGIPSEYEADYSFSMGVNLLYDNNIGDHLNYWFFTPRDYSIQTLRDDPNANLAGKIRGPEFAGKASNMVAIYQDGSGCLLVLDPVYSAMKSDTAGYADFGSLTNFDRIVDSGADTTTFPQVFGSISQNNWCYYFEKADLARQEKNWLQVIDIYDQARQAGFTPGHSVEYIPEIEAMAEQGQVPVALDITNEAIQFSATVTPAACKLWSNLMQEHPNFTATQVTQALGQGVCSFK